MRVQYFYDVYISVHHEQTILRQADFIMPQLVLKGLWPIDAQRYYIEIETEINIVLKKLEYP